MIQFQIDKSRGTPAYLQLVNQVREALRMGWLNTGDRLPTARDVVVTCGINHNTVLKAYRELELAGLVETQQGKGTFICASLGSADPAAIERLRRQLARSIQEALQAGLAIEDVQAVVTSVLAQDKFTSDRPRNPKNKVI